MINNKSNHKLKPCVASHQSEQDTEAAVQWDRQHQTVSSSLQAKDRRPTHVDQPPKSALKPLPLIRRLLGDLCQILTHTSTHDHHIKQLYITWCYSEFLVLADAKRAALFLLEVWPWIENVWGQWIIFSGLGQCFEFCFSAWHCW